MKKQNKSQHLKKMQKLRRKMLRAWALKKNEKAQKTHNKIIRKTLEYKKLEQE